MIDLRPSPSSRYFSRVFFAVFFGGSQGATFLSTEVVRGSPRPSLARLSLQFSETSLASSYSLHEAYGASSRGFKRLFLLGLSDVVNSEPSLSPQGTILVLT